VAGYKIKPDAFCFSRSSDFTEHPYGYLPIMCNIDSTIESSKNPLNKTAGEKQKTHGLEKTGEPSEEISLLPE
jgi:hypothetical protein